MINYLVLLSLISPSPSEDQLARRVEAHLTVKDLPSARIEAQEAVARYPNSELLLAVYIKALANSGDEKEMLKAWNRYSLLFPEKSLNRHLIEEMAWGVLNKAAHSSSLVMRQLALLAALFSQDAKGVNILFQGLQDSNYAIRAIAVSLSGHLHDEKLKKQIKHLFKEEKTWLVRQKVVEAVGSMKINELRSDLEALIASDQSLAEEKALAIKSLVDLLDCIERNEVLRLARSDRAGLRLLACEAIAHFRSQRDLDQLMIMASDFQPDVRAAALQAIGLLKPVDGAQTIINLARSGSRDANYRVAISSAWLLTLYEPNEGMHFLAWHLNSEKREQRLMAAGALRAAGHYGAPLALKLFQSHADPYVRLNLALGLIGQRLAIPEVCRELEQIMSNNHEKWCQSEVGLIHFVANKQIGKESDSDTTPEMEDQLLRLEILNLLAILKSPNAQRSIRQCLAERSWGITGAAAALLLTEGDDAAIDLVQSLLNDPQPKVRLQAALVLSLWSHEESAVQALEQAYRESEKEQKCRILEGLGRIGSMKSVPFLIQVLNEPSQTLRLIAAMALIQCLNH